MAIEAIVRKQGAPDGLICTVVVNSSEVAALIADNRTAAITLTGSTQGGAIVAAQAGKAFKKQALEFGGSDPFIVLANGDVERPQPWRRGFASSMSAKAAYLPTGRSWQSWCATRVPAA